jgi:hypothetical protein
VRSEDDANDELAHLFESIFEQVTEGVRDYYRDHPAVNHKHRVGTRRNVVRDYVVYRLRGALSEVSGIHIFDKNQTTYFGISSRWLGRVHMVGRDLSAASNDTQKSMAFQYNNAATALGPEVAGATCLRIAYHPNAKDPMNPGVFIVCPSANGPEWFIELSRGSGAQVISVPSVLSPDVLDPVVEVIEQPMRKSNDE